MEISIERVEATRFELASMNTELRRSEVLVSTCESLCFSKLQSRLSHSAFDSHRPSTRWKVSKKQAMVNSFRRHCSLIASNAARPPLKARRSHLEPTIAECNPCLSLCVVLASKPRTYARNAALTYASCQSSPRAAPARPQSLHQTRP